ncbi:hypothetical protein J6590_107681, partial [Homalodisca vitripennis]
MLEKMGINPGKNCTDILSKLDFQRVLKAEKTNEPVKKMARKHARMLKKKKQDEEVNQDDTDYNPGMFK